MWFASSEKAGYGAWTTSTDDAMPTSPRIDRRNALSALSALALVLYTNKNAHAFGDAGAFNPRALLTGADRWDAARRTGPGRWSWELARRTSAPARLTPTTVLASDPKLLAEPFVIWGGATEMAPLPMRDVRAIERFLRLGGVMIVDDFDPASGAFGRSARREIGRVLPESAPVRLDDDHVIYRTFYLLDRPVGRVAGTPHVDAIVRGRTAQVIFLHHDLMGALARSKDGGWALEMVEGGVEQREYAVRFAVNLAMYVLCSDYKDDQVHAPFIMRRRATRHE